jgi:hypothetical protein
MPWDHITPIHGHPMQADIDCSGLQYPAKFVVAGDFDGDHLTELVVAPNAGGSRGNDLWVMKYNAAAGLWRHMSPIPNHAMEADIDCSGLKFPAKFAVAADFDGDRADELVVAPAAANSAGNDFWVMKFDRASATWRHMGPIPNHPMEADIDCSGQQFPAKFAVAGDFDGDGHAELVVVPDAGGSRGNDLWVMKFFGIFAAPRWMHMAPIPNHPMDADIDCSGVQYPAKFVVVADFDGDGRAELVVAPDAGGSRGNDLWVMKYVGTFPQGHWQHMAPIPNHPMDADIDCSGKQFPAKFAIAGDFDGDGRAELVVAPDAGGSRGNDLWVMKYVGTFPQGQWQHMAPIPNHPMDADIDCSGHQFPAKFALVADLDGDKRDELVVVPDAEGSRGNDFWVMKYVGVFPQGEWQHMAPIPDHPMDADIDCSGTQFPAKLAIVGDFDRDGADELVIVPDAGGSSGNDLWAMKYFGTYPGGSFDHMTPIPNHPMDADIDCSSSAFPAKLLVVGNFDGDAPELMVAPEAGGSRGNDFWVLGYPEQSIRVINMIPNSLSAETNQDSEPNLTVNPANPSQMVGSAFTPNPAAGPAPPVTAPIFVSQNGGTTWVLNNILPSAGFTHDITVRFATTTNNLYAGILREPGNGTRDILRTNDFISVTPMTRLITRDHVDQPYLQALSVTDPSGKPADRVYVGNNDMALFNRPNTGPTATVDLSQDATAAPPSGFGPARIDQRTNAGQDGPPIRPAVHLDGTVYAAFYRWTTIVGSFNPSATITADVVVVRDDNWGAGATPFSALVDSRDNIAGLRVVTGKTVPFNSVSQASFGQERFVGSNLSIAVDPRDSSVVYVAWADRIGADDYTLHVRTSTNRGVTWSDDLRTITNATNPALAVNGTGKVAFLYQALTGNDPSQGWDTHVELTTDNWRSPPTDVFLATVPADAPVATFMPYIGDYVHILALGRDYFGVFSANNEPNNAHFPSGVIYQRNANFTTQTLLNLDNATPVPESIDPFFFSISPRAAARLPSRPRG